MHFNKRTILENRATVLINFDFLFAPYFPDLSISSFPFLSNRFFFFLSFPSRTRASVFFLTRDSIYTYESCLRKIGGRRIVSQALFIRTEWNNGCLREREREREREIFHVLTWFRRNAQAFLTVVRYFENAEFAHCRD